MVKQKMVARDNGRKFMVAGAVNIFLTALGHEATNVKTLAVDTERREILVTEFGRVDLGDARVLDSRKMQPGVGVDIVFHHPFSFPGVMTGSFREDHPSVNEV